MMDSSAKSNTLDRKLIQNLKKKRVGRERTRAVHNFFLARRATNNKLTEDTIRHIVMHALLLSSPSKLRKVSMSSEGWGMNQAFRKHFPLEDRTRRGLFTKLLQ